MGLRDLRLASINPPVPGWWCLCGPVLLPVSGGRGSLKQSVDVIGEVFLLSDQSDDDLSGLDEFLVKFSLWDLPCLQNEHL